MADAAKTRKPPTPRGLTVEIPMEHTTRALQLAQGAGMSTKAEVEAALSEFIVERYLEPFLAHLANRAVARVQQLLNPGGAPPPGEPSKPDSELLAALKRQNALTPDGGIPLVPAKED